MAGVVRKVHPSTSFSFGTVDDYAADLHIRRGSTNGSEGEVPDAVAFLDPDGEMHVFVLGPDGREKLIAQLTGVIVVPGGSI